MSEKIRPLGDRLLVEMNESDNETSAGLTIPDSAKEKQQRGLVVDVGPGRILDDGRQIKVEANVGDEVIFVKFAGNEMTIEGKKVVILREDEVLGILEKTKETE